MATEGSPLQVTVDPQHNGARLDAFVAEIVQGISRSRLQQAIARGRIRVNDDLVKKNTRLQGGDRITIDTAAVEREHAFELKPESIDLDIIYEDEWIIAVNKPAGLVVHPGSGNKKGTLVNALLNYASDLSDGSAPERPGIVHRLDKDTSGILLIARSNEAHAAFSALFAARQIRKKYIGFCIGPLPPPQEIIDAPIGRSRRDRVKQSVMRSGREAVTECRLLAHESGISIVNFFPVSGRTHQIRVHASHWSRPIVMDATYGGLRQQALKLQPLERPFAYKVYNCFDRHALHAHIIEFEHPFTQKAMKLKASLPQDFRAAGVLFGNDCAL
ncbi:MAG: RluA family pseudouridine synthase [Chitinivibrionales bacterium]|nr:RluA family pseudouridine synthase [Chitinivibrionales bacterium]